MIKVRAKPDLHQQVVQMLNVEKMTKTQCAEELGIDQRQVDTLIRRNHLPVPIRSDAPKTGITAWKKYEDPAEKDATDGE